MFYIFILSCPYGFHYKDLQYFYLMVLMKVIANETLTFLMLCLTYGAPKGFHS